MKKYQKPDFFAATAEHPHTPMRVRAPLNTVEMLVRTNIFERDFQSFFNSSFLQPIVTYIVMSYIDSKWTTFDYNMYSVRVIPN